MIVIEQLEFFGEVFVKFIQIFRFDYICPVVNQVILSQALFRAIFEKPSYEIFWNVPIDHILQSSALSFFVPALPFKVSPDLLEVIKLLSVRARAVIYTLLL